MLEMYPLRKVVRTNLVTSDIIHELICL